MQATKLQHEIEDLQRRSDNIKMKLTSEMKVKNVKTCLLGIIMLNNLKVDKLSVFEHCDAYMYL